MNGENIAMPTGLAGSGLMPQINNPKSFNVEQASNGFIIRTQNRRSYDSRSHIAADVDAVTAIIRDYLTSEEA